MHIDFHHTVTYVLARLADFSQQEAEIIAYCSQYVDDATGSGIIEFENGALFNHESSAHKMLDYHDFSALGTHKVWLPFHFLPGNDMAKEKEDPLGMIRGGNEPKDSFIRKIICKPNSYPARDMVQDCIDKQHLPYALHRLGITLHVYADTWAHQGFAGVNHEVNSADDLRSTNHKFHTGFLDRIASHFITEAYPLGHGAVLSYPDQPFLEWEYVNGLGKKIKRNNPEEYMQAVDHLFHVLLAYKNKDTQIDFNNLIKIPDNDRETIKNLFIDLVDDYAENRHEEWIKLIKKGTFSFGQEELEYNANEKKWKNDALKPKDRSKPQVLIYPDDFLESNWKYFHDALLAHRFTVLHDILPKYGICAA